MKRTTTHHPANRPKDLGRAIWVSQALTHALDAKTTNQAIICSIALDMSSDAARITPTITAATATRALADWSMKDRHNSMMRRPGPQTPWGSVTDEDWALHLLQSFDGLGLEKARALKKHFGGVPMNWACTEEELRDVPGIGKVLAARLIGALK